jgi:hypothetical protein
LIESKNLQKVRITDVAISSFSRIAILIFSIFSESALVFDVPPKPTPLSCRVTFEDAAYHSKFLKNSKNTNKTN